MSSLYAGANSFPANVTIPSDGDPKDAASVNAALEGLADRTKWLSINMLDGLNGGTYAPGAQIDIGGSGLKISTTLEIPNAGAIIVDSGGFVHFENGSASQYDATYTEDNFGGTTWKSASTTTWESGAIPKFKTTVTVETATGILEVKSSGKIVVDSTGELDINGPLVMGNGGNVQLRVATIIDAGAQVFGASGVDELRIIDSLANARDVVITNTGAHAGNRIRVTNAQSFAITLKRDDASTIGVVKIEAGKYYWVDLIFTGGSWKLSAFQIIA